jgi:arylsulfatase
VLKQAGYQTWMCGKWHVSLHTGPNGPKHTWPLQRGFEKFFGTILGAGSYFDPATLTQDNHFVRATASFYYTEAISEQAAEYIERASRNDNPFFLYVAYTAPHWPLHARPEDVRLYQGRYSIGWDSVRERRHQRMIQLGVVKRQWPLAPRDPRVLPWSETPHRDWHQRRMEVYAAQITCMDRGIGRILEKVRQVGRERNTLILFLSDNGGCAEEVYPGWEGLHIPERTRNGSGVEVGNKPNIIPGPENTYQSYGVPWANVSNTPFRLYERWVHEGGIATPLVVSWPAVIRSGGRMAGEVGHVADVMATCVEAAGIRYPTHFEGFTIKPLEGQSLLPIFLGRTRQRRPLFWEHEGNRAVRDGKWKLVCDHPGDWELYDMEADRTELKNLAAQYPEMVEQLDAMYHKWARRTGVLPWPK